MLSRGCFRIFPKLPHRKPVRAVFPACAAFHFLPILGFLFVCGRCFLVQRVFVTNLHAPTCILYFQNAVLPSNPTRPLSRGFFIVRRDSIHFRPESSSPFPRWLPVRGRRSLLFAGFPYFIFLLKNPPLLALRTLSLLSGSPPQQQICPGRAA